MGSPVGGGLAVEDFEGEEGGGGGEEFC
jgi:hypothetical protein